MSSSPDYAKGAFGLGGDGGAGVLLARRDRGWRPPAFFNVGGISIGAQAGFEAGDLVMVLTSDRPGQLRERCARIGTFLADNVRELLVRWRSTQLIHSLDRPRRAQPRGPT